MKPRFPLKPAGALAGALCAFLAIACAGKLLPQPNEAQAAWSTRSGRPSTLESLQEGRRLYVEKCDGCHSIPYVQDYTPREWVKLMDDMRIEAKLTNREDALIRSYVFASAQWVRDSLSMLP